MSFTAAWQWPF